MGSVEPHCREKRELVVPSHVGQGRRGGREDANCRGRFRFCIEKPAVSKSCPFRAQRRGQQEQVGGSAASVEEHETSDDDDGRARGKWVCGVGKIGSEKLAGRWGLFGCSRSQCVTGTGCPQAPVLLMD